MYTLGTDVLIACGADVQNYDPHTDPHYRVLMKADAKATNAQCIQILKHAKEMLEKSQQVAKGGLFDRALNQQDSTIKNQIDVIDTGIARIAQMSPSDLATKETWEFTRWRTLGALSQYAAMCEGRIYQDENFYKLLEDIWNNFKELPGKLIKGIPWWFWLILAGGGVAALGVTVGPVVFPFIMSRRR
jgi:hypothetical protein